MQPRFGSNLGGKPVTLSGPCFLPSDNVMCSFGGKTTQGRVIESVRQAECIVPPSINTRGRVSLSVSQNGGNNYTDFSVFIYGEYTYIDFFRLVSWVFLILPRRSSFL